jgi:hypothetical protein
MDSTHLDLLHHTICGTHVSILFSIYFILYLLTISGYGSTLYWLK